MKRFLAFVISCLIIMSVVSVAFAEVDIEKEQNRRETQMMAESMRNSTTASYVSASSARIGEVAASDYNYITFTVPSGWSSYEADNGYVVYAQDQYDSSSVVMFAIGQINGRSLYNIVQDVMSDYSGSSLSSNSSGSGTYYFFAATVLGQRGTMWVCDTNSSIASVSVPSGWYFIRFHAWATDFDTYWDMLTSVKINPSSSTSNNGNTGQTTGGTTQTVDGMTMTVPSGWYAQDSNGIATIRSSSNAGLIMLATGSLGSQTLYGRTESLRSSLTSSETTEIQQGNSGYYYFYATNSSGVTFVAFVDDHSTYSPIPDGNYCIQMFTTNDATWSAFSTIWDSISFTSSGGTGSNGTGGNTTIDTGNMGTVLNNDTTTNTNNNSSGGNTYNVDMSDKNDPNFTKNTTNNISGSGACNSGFGLIVLMMLGAAVRRRRS